MQFPVGDPKADFSGASRAGSAGAPRAGSAGTPRAGSAGAPRAGYVGATGEDFTGVGSAGPIYLINKTKEHSKTNFVNKCIHQTVLECQLKFAKIKQQNNLNNHPYMCIVQCLYIFVIQTLCKNILLSV